MIGPLLQALALALPQAAADEPEPAYVLTSYTPPEGVVLEVGGMDFLPDGRLVVSTRRGEVWLVEDALADDPARARFSKFADGLQDGLGLKVVDGAVYVVQRGELSRLVDADADGYAETVETVCDDWGLTGNYHEFAFGLPHVDEHFFVSLNVGFFNPEWWHGRSGAPYRGWIVRIDGEGRMEPFACGLRSPCGLGLNAAGDLFCTDNQGDWMPVCPIFHVQEGRFYGHPASLDWTPEYRASGTHASRTIPPARERAPAACWLPYKWSRSAGNLVVDDTGGRFGPFADQLFVAELTNGRVLRAQLEKVRGEYQGACFPFREKLGSVCRVHFAPDGSMLLGLTNRGWGGRAPGHGLARLRWTGATPFAIREARLRQDGFALTFTEPVAHLPAPEEVTVIQYDYDYWWEYGSPERAHERREVASLTLAEDGRSAVLLVEGLVAGKVARVVLPGVRSRAGRVLAEDEFHYTINQLPEGPLSTAHVAKVVPPPPAREKQDTGWLRMTWGAALDAWRAEGWELCDAELDPADPTRFVTRPGNGALANTAAERPTDYVSRYAFTDFDLHLGFLLPAEGRSGVRLLDEVELELSADPARCGTVHHAGRTFAPATDVFREPGQWHELDLTFRAPRSTAAGVTPAVLEGVSIDGVLIHERLELEVAGPAAADTARAGPVVLLGERTPVGFGNVRVRPHADGEPPAGMLEDDELKGFQVQGEVYTDFDGGVLVLSGGPGALVSDRADWRNARIACEVKVSDGGLADLVLRGDPEDPAAGYALRVNASHPDPQRTGSLVGRAPVRVGLVGYDTWTRVELVVRTREGETEVLARVNGVVVASHVEPAGSAPPGRVLFRQLHESSVLEVRGLVIEELP